MKKKREKERDREKEREKKKGEKGRRNVTYLLSLDLEIRS